MSISSPRTALVRPTSKTMSGRNRVVAYHSLSLVRPKLLSWTFALADVTWSMSPEIVTFGAGACARTGGASIAMVTKAKTAVTRNFLITASSVVVSSHLIGPCHFHRHHQQLQTPCGQQAPCIPGGGLRSSENCDSSGF